MNTASENPGQDWDDTAEDAPERATAGSRRLLLGGAGGSLVLTASGLFLPDWLEQAEAREGALDGAKGGRRGQDHKGRHRKRNHGDKKDKHNGRDDAPRGGDQLFRSSALTVVNFSLAPVDCTFFYRIKTGLDDYALPTANGTQTINNDQSYRYDPDRYRVGVLIKEFNDGKDIYVDVRNVSFWYPRGGVTTGVNLDPPGGNYGDTFIREENYFEGEGNRRMTVELKRLHDDSKGAKRIEWQLTLLVI